MAYRGQGLGKQDQQGDQDADDGFGGLHHLQRILDARRKRLGQPDHADQRDQQQAEARPGQLQ